jgi:transposase
MLKEEELFLIRDLSSQNLSISEIARQTGFDRKTVSKYLQKTLPEPQKRPGRKSKLDPYKPYLLKKLEEGPYTAVLDRILHHCTTINIKGESYRLKERKKQGIKTVNLYQ